MFLLSTIVSLLYLASDDIGVVKVVAAATVAIFVIIFAGDVNIFAAFAATPLVTFAAAVVVSILPARDAVDAATGGQSRVRGLVVFIGNGMF